MKCSPFSCFSEMTTNAVETADNTSINKHLKIAEKSGEKTIRILLLGPGSCGKTTIIKQMKKIHGHDSIDELNDRKSIARDIKQAIVDYMRILCVESVELHNKYNENTLLSQENEDLRQEIVSLSAPYILTYEIAQKLKMLWTDDGIKNTLRKRQYFQIAENVGHFLDRIETISTASYVASFEDYVRFRKVTIGLTQTKININVDRFGEYIFDFTDVGGQRSERRKWMQYISEDINAVIYVLAISDYDLTMYEDNKTNRLIDSIELFRNTMTKGSFFQKKSVLVFFNKYDLFIEKIKNTPITVAFDDFPPELNAYDAHDVVRFVAEKCLNVLIDANIELITPLHIMRTNALDSNNMEKVFNTVSSDLVQENLKDLNFI